MVALCVVICSAATADTFHSDLGGYLGCEKLSVFILFPCDSVPLLDETLMLRQVLIINLIPYKLTNSQMTLANKRLSRQIDDIHSHHKATWQRFLKFPLKRGFQLQIIIFD